MSKKITHEQARESIEMVDGSFFPTEKEALLAYIKQQEKREKLMELYKELATLYRDRFDYTNSATEIKRLWGKIKELEND